MSKTAQKESSTETPETPVPEGIFSEPQKVDNVDLNFGFGDEPEEEADGDEDLITDDVEIIDGEESEAEESTSDTAEEVQSDEEEAGADEEAAESDAEVSDEAGDEVSNETEEVEAKSSKKTHMVPKSRLDQVLAKNKDLARKVEQLEEAAKADTSTQEQGTFDFDAKEMEYMDAVVEGDKQTALALRKEIDAAKEAQWQTRSTVGNNRDRQREIFEDAAAAWEQEFDVLNARSENFDESLTKSVIAYTKGLQEQGMSPVDALNEASQTLLRAKGYIVDDEQVPETTQVAEEVAKRKKDTVRKKVKAAKSQPKTLSKGEGPSQRDTDEIDVSQLTEEEFNALPPKTIARLRGDFG